MALEENTQGNMRWSQDLRWPTKEIMPVEYSAEIARIGDLLKGGGALATPPYQREYTWGFNEIDVLISRLSVKLNDISERGEESGSYYFGHMLLLAPSIVAERRSLIGLGRTRRVRPARDIVDGKQRMVTITIILAVLRDLLGSTGAALQPYIATPHTVAGQGLTWTPNISLSGDEVAFLREFIVEPGSTSRRVPVGQRSRGARQMRRARWRIRRELKDDSWSPERLSALARLLTEKCIVALTQTNNLASAYDMFVVNNGTGLKLASSDLLKAMLIGASLEGRRAEYHRTWTELEGRIGSKGIEGLFSHINTLDSGRHTPIVEQIPAMAARIGFERFLDDHLLPTARNLEIVLTAAHADAPQSEEINRLLTYLGWLKSHDWTPPVLAFMRQRPGDAEGLLRFLKAIDRLAYGHLLVGLGSEKRRQRYKRVLDWVVAGQAIDAPASPLALTRDEQRGAYFNAVTRLYARGTLVCKLVLLRLCETYPGSRLPKDIKRVSVEHVLPQNIGNGEYWRERFKDAEERDLAVRSIANSVLVWRNQNDRARNYSWPQKHAVYFPEGKDTPFAVTNQLKGLADWTPVELREREADLVKRLADLWSLDAQGAVRRRKPRVKPAAA
jgi:hypothetical protein